MNIQPFEKLACPLDGNNLKRQDSIWCCADGHTFDIARQGYSNLLLVQNMRSRSPGDSKKMVSARTRFLQQGFYSPIAKIVSTLIDTRRNQSSEISCLDSGCGEGYYLNQIIAQNSKHQFLSLIGLDISKWAVKAAAINNKSATWIVATNANLPIQSQSLDYVLCIFGFPVYKEYLRVLKTSGQLIMVSTGPNHLRELRNIIYADIHDKSKKIRLCPEEFVGNLTKNLTYSVELSTKQQISDLLEMTPHLYRANKEGIAKAAALDKLEVTIDVNLEVFSVDNASR